MPTKTAAPLTPITPEDRNFFSTENIAYIGDFVQDHLGRKGRVTAVHFSCPQKDSWLRRQRTLPGNPMDWKHARWASVLIHNGGSVVVPEQELTVIDAFELANDCAAFYFRPQS